jgi:thiol-disulfide isomerase/thioredoxin
MKTVKRNFLIILIIFFSTVSYSLELGDQAPNLNGINAIDGSRIDLYKVMTQMRFKKDSKGKLLVGENGKYVTEFIEYVVVLNFFSKICIPCIKEIPFFNRIADKYWNKNVVFLYANIDHNVDEAEAKRLIQKYKIVSPMILVSLEEAIRKYNADRLPRLFVIDKKGKVVKIVEGFNENLESELSRVIDNLL